MYFFLQNIGGSQTKCNYKRSRTKSNANLILWFVSLKNYIVVAKAFEFILSETMMIIDFVEYEWCFSLYATLVLLNHDKVSKYIQLEECPITLMGLNEILFGN